MAPFPLIVVIRYGGLFSQRNIICGDHEDRKPLNHGTWTESAKCKEPSAPAGPTFYDDSAVINRLGNAMRRYNGFLATENLPPGADGLSRANKNVECLWVVFGTRITALGLKTAYVPRPLEYGPDREIDATPDPSFDVNATDFNDLADQLGLP